MKKTVFSYLLIAIFVATGSITTFAETKATSETVDFSAKTDQTVSLRTLLNDHFTGPDNCTIYVTTMYDEKKVEKGLFGTRVTTVQRSYYREPGAGTKSAPGYLHWHRNGVIHFGSSERRAQYFVYVTRRDDKVVTKFLQWDYRDLEQAQCFKVFTTDKDDPMIYDAETNFFIPLAVYQEWLKDANGDLAVVDKIN